MPAGAAVFMAAFSAVRSVVVAAVAGIAVPFSEKLTLPLTESPLRVAVVEAVAVHPVAVVTPAVTKPAICWALMSVVTTKGAVAPVILLVRVKVWTPTLFPAVTSAPAAAGVRAKTEVVASGVLVDFNKSMPRSAALAEGMEKEIVSLALAPTWNWEFVRVPSRMFFPLEEVLAAILVISCCSWLTSA